MERSAFERYLSSMLDADVLIVDTETTGLEVRDGRAYCMGISVAYWTNLGLFTAYFPFRHESDNLPREWLPELFSTLERCYLIFHNAKFDIPSLETLGYKHEGQFFCTQVGAHLLQETLPSKELDYVSKVWLKEEKGEDGDAIARWGKTFGWGTVPAGLMARRARKDVELTYKLFEYEKPRLQGEELYPAYWDREAQFTRVLIKVEKRGVLLDQELCNKLAYTGENRMLDIEYALGFTPSKSSELEDFLFNHLKIPVLDEHRTPKGKPSLDKEAMELYDIRLSQMGDPSAQMVLEYRGWQKAVSNWYKGWTDKVSPDGRLRPNYLMHRAKTGRLTCQAPNLQQVPRRSNKAWNGNVKQCIIPQSGFKLIEFDYKAIEFRLGAAYAGEQGIVESINNGGDPHYDTAMLIYGRSDDDLRFTSKTQNFLMLFGGGEQKLAWHLGKPLEEVIPIHRAWHEVYPGFRRTSKTASELAKQRGYIRNWCGRRRHFDSRFGDYHKAFNFVIQGGAAEIIKTAMINLDRILDENECRMVLQIHDSVVFEICEDLVNQYIPVITQVMEDFPQFGVKIETDHHTWGE